MKKAVKTIFIYLGVLILALIATVIFCAAFLFFYREGNIFGIQYINSKQVIYAQETDSMDGLQTIEVNSSSYDVYVEVNPNVDTLMGAMRNEVFGYVKKSKAQAKFALDYNATTKTAVFSSVEPKGWLNKKDACIVIAIPTSWISSGYNLKVKTAKGDITIGNDYDLTIGSLEVETTKGEAVVKNVTLNSKIDVSIGSGLLYLDENCETSVPIDADISVGSGTINFSKVNVDKFELGVVEVNKIKNGKIGIKEAVELVTDGNINGGGEVQINSVAFVDFASLDTNIYINSITYGVGNSEALSSRITITGQGKVSINSANCNLEINGHNGNINVKTVAGTMALSSNQGDISVAQALKLVSAISEYGNINITFSDVALDYVDTDLNDANKNRAVVATTKNGHIIVNGLQNGYVTATGTGRISLNYHKVRGTNEIMAKSGVVNIVVPNPTETSAVNDCAFNLKLNSEVNTDIKVGVAGSIGSVDFDSSGSHVFNNIYNSASSTANNLSVESTTGCIKIRSRDLMNY